MPRIPEDALVATIRRLLRPVVRQLLAWGVSYQVFDRVVRGLFVEVAEEDFALPAKKQTDSRFGSFAVSASANAICAGCR